MRVRITYTNAVTNSTRTLVINAEHSSDANEAAKQYIQEDETYTLTIITMLATPQQKRDFWLY